MRRVALRLLICGWLEHKPALGTHGDGRCIRCGKGVYKPGPMC